MINYFFPLITFPIIRRSFYNLGNILSTLKVFLINRAVPRPDAFLLSLVSVGFAIPSLYSWCGIIRFWS